jgi:hypothetical protein
MPKPNQNSKQPGAGQEKEPDPRERLLKSDLSFEDLTRSILNKKPPPGGWTDREGAGEDEQER